MKPHSGFSGVAQVVSWAAKESQEHTGDKYSKHAAALGQREDQSSSVYDLELPELPSGASGILTLYDFHG